MIHVAGISLGWPFEYAGFAVVEAQGTTIKYLIDDQEPETRLPMRREVPIEGAPVRMRLRHLEQFDARIGYEEIARSARGKLLQIRQVLLALECTRTGHGALDLFDRMNLSPTVGVVLGKEGIVSGEGRAWTVSAQEIVNRVRLAVGERRFIVAGKLKQGRAVLDAAMAHIEKSAELDPMLAAVGVAVWLVELEIVARAEAELGAQQFAAAMRQGGVKISPV